MPIVILKISIVRIYSALLQSDMFGVMHDVNVISITLKPVMSGVHIEFTYIHISSTDLKRGKQLSIQNVYPFSIWVFAYYMSC